MNLHEYQAKQLFREYDISVSEGLSASSSQEAEKIALSLNVEKWVVKAQVHAGGRGKSGGVELVDSIKKVKAFADKWLGKNLVTFQTDEKGQPVNQILIETVTDIHKELYLGAVIDRASQKLVVMASTEGGVNIEEVAEETPEKIYKAEIDPILGPNQLQAEKLANSLNLNEVQTLQFIDIFNGLVRLFIDKDLSLVEVNPLVITSSGDLICLDAKIPNIENANDLNMLLISSEAANAHKNLVLEKHKLFNEQTLMRILIGAFTSKQEYKKLLRYRIQFIHEFLYKAFEEVDILIAPVWPCYIPNIKESDLGANSDAAYLVRRIGHNTRPINYLGLPAISIPTGFDPNGLPLSVQLIGKPFSENLLLRVAYALEKQFSFWDTRPDI